ncbi:GIY-YIG nuclease family protein [Mesorhizobium caraganae]|uniref:GIY-YIG nuclease family protein n=1 Tax=Mesorhizobium caraganae TaxID=483206 RepID=UPI00193A441A|nr:GIY-YIG nuclease family protein [Mesorhizobium caraganae]MBM2711061.1 GIY-YIG nuclease family protein [Mesorhizobium caraganae]
MGYSEFELNIPAVLRAELPKYFDDMAASALTEENVRAQIPDGAQGAYLLYLRDALVYIGKTDSKAGFRNRLIRHLNFVQHRRNLDPVDVRFKAVRIFVFSNFDLEAMLIEEYTRHRGARPVWNYSGFGSNDPGRRREGQDPAVYDLEFPVDIDQEVPFLKPGAQPLLSAMLALKDGLPYIFRYDTAGEHWSRGHHLMRDRMVTVPEGRMTTRLALKLFLGALPDGWRATVLPNRVILYPERDDAIYPGQVEALFKDP